MVASVMRELLNENWSKYKNLRPGIPWTLSMTFPITEAICLFFINSHVDEEM